MQEVGVMQGKGPGPRSTGDLQKLERQGKEISLEPPGETRLADALALLAQ